MHPVLRHLTMGAASLAIIATIPSPAVSQAIAGDGDIKVAVIDVTRLVTDSQAGKQVLEVLQKLSEEKSAGLKVLADELEGIQTQINDGRLSLSEERLSELQRQLEDKTISFRRARDDAERELQEMQAQRFGEIETQVMPIINEVGQQRGYTLIFNKFESGLVFAQDTADITDEILQRFNSRSGAPEPAPAAEGGDG